MDLEEFRLRGKEMVDYMCEYLTTLEKRRVTPDVEPGYLRNLLPENAPENPEKWDQIMKDVEDKIMPGVTHWQHPKFHAYFPAGNSFPSILGDMLSDAIGCIGFSWAASPACTELETIVLDWVCRALGLPEFFLAGKYGSTGGGCIQSSASECILVCMLAARHRALTRLANEAGEPPSPEGEPILLRRTHHLPKLVAYCSTEAHSSVEKAAGICLVRLRPIETDSTGSMCVEKLREAIQSDLREGLEPFFVSCTFGSTASTSFDDLPKIGPLVRNLDPNTWIHIDAAYAGSALLCPELRYLMPGIENADSFNTNPNKWMLTNFDCSLMWVKDRYRLTDALTVNPLYLHHFWANEAIDYRHWGIPLSRRFRALKLWFVLRNYGLNGLRDYIRRHVYLAARFAAHVRTDPRFEVTNNPRLGLVCFRLLGKDNSITSDRLTHELLVRLNTSGYLHVVPAHVNGTYSIRFCACAEKCSENDIDEAFKKICDVTQEIIEPTIRKRPPPLARMKSKRFSFTRSISREMYARTTSRTNLYDGATPILVPEDEFEFPEEENGENNGVEELPGSSTHGNFTESTSRSGTSKNEEKDLGASLKFPGEEFGFKEVPKSSISKKKENDLGNSLKLKLNVKNVDN